MRPSGTPHDAELGFFPPPACSVGSSLAAHVGRREMAALDISRRRNQGKPYGICQNTCCRQLTEGYLVTADAVYLRQTEHLICVGQSQGPLVP